MLDDLMGQMKNMMAASNAKLDAIRAEVEKEGISVVCNGHRHILDIRISDVLMAENDKDKLEDLLLAAINEAMAKAEEQSGKEIKGLTNGLMPGGLDGLF